VLAPNGNVWGFHKNVIRKPYNSTKLVVWVVGEIPTILIHIWLKY